jgi:hypothetical protein
MLTAVAALTLLGALVVPSMAQAHVLPTSVARDFTAKAAARGAAANGAETSGVYKCERGSAHNVKCAGYYLGHAIDPNGVSQPWGCAFVIRFVLTNKYGGYWTYNGYRVRISLGARMCGGPGEPYRRPVA